MRTLLPSASLMLCLAAGAHVPDEIKTQGPAPVSTPAPAAVAFSRVKILYQPPAPPYPALARIAHIQGTVVVEVVLDAQGRPESAHALEGPPQLRSAAEAFLMQWRFEAVPVDGKPARVRFPVTMPFRLSGGTPPQAAGDGTLTGAANQAYFMRDYARAASLFERATRAEPTSSEAWQGLGRACNALEAYDKAIPAFRKVIDLEPRNLYAYNNLGLSFRALKQFPEAEAAFRQQIDLNQDDPYAHHNLGSLLVEEGRFQEALPELEEAARVRPKEERLQAELGRALLGLGQEDKALQVFDRLAKASPAPGILNAMAYGLALAKTSLDLARQYAEQAVSTLEARLATGKLGELEVEQEEAGFTLVQTWDTLGWIHFLKGDLDQARRYLDAAWLLGGHGEVADHLGQLHERLGDKDEAVRHYALALASARPPAGTRGRLERLLGPGGDPEAEIQRRRPELLQSRSLTVPAPGVEAGAGEFYFVLAPGGRITGAELIAGPEGRRAMEAPLARARHAFLFPDESCTRILLRGLTEGREGAAEVSVRFLEPEAWRRRPGGASVNNPAAPMKLLAAKRAEWAGPEGAALGFTEEKLKAYADAQMDPSDGTRGPVLSWLEKLSGAQDPSLSAWALARRLEMGDASAFAPYRHRMAQHLIALSENTGGGRGPVLQDPPGLPSARVVKAGSPFWKAFENAIRAGLDQPMDSGTYAVWCYGTAASQRGLILEVASKVALQVTTRNPELDAWNDPRFWIIVDWALAWGSPEDFEAIRQALPPGPSRNEFGRIQARLQKLKRFWDVPAAPGQAVAPSLLSNAFSSHGSGEILHFDFSQMKVKVQPRAPSYPEEAKARHLSSTIAVEITVGPDGAPIQSHLRPGPWLAFFGPTAYQYSLDWRFEPAMLNGVPQTARFLLTMPFKLHHP